MAKESFQLLIFYKMENNTNIDLCEGSRCITHNITLNKFYITYELALNSFYSLSLDSILNHDARKV